MLTIREIDLIHFLADKKHTPTISDLSEHFKIGERSIRYHIENINIFMKQEVILVDKGSCYLQHKEEVLTSINSKSILYSTKLKKQCLLYQIVFRNEVNLTSFSEELEISRTSIKLYFDEIRKKLESSHLSLQQEHKKGFVLIGDEADIRKYQQRTLAAYKRLKPIEQNTLSLYITPYTTKVNEQAIDRYLVVIQKELNTLLSDQSYEIIKTYLQIVIARIQLNLNLNASSNTKFLHEASEYQCLKKHLPILESSCNIRISEDETLSFVDLFIGSHYFYESNSKVNNWFEYELLVSKLINLFSEEYPINLHQDYLLYQSLMTHLKPTLYRLLNNMKVTEIDHDVIYKQFPKEFETTKEALQKLHFFTNVTIDSDEIALITLHFKAAINRHQSLYSKQVNLLIVCSHGYGTSQLLKQQLLETYDVNIIDCIPAHFLNNMPNLSNIDLIITTIPNLNSKENIPTIKVDSILTDHNFALLDNTLLVKQKNKIRMSQLIQVVSDSCLINDKKKLEVELLANFNQNIVNDIDNMSYSLLHLLPPQNIKLNLEVESWQDAIQFGGVLLENSGFSNEVYTNQLVTSFENYGSYMIIDEGVAIPHSKSDESVIRTGMSLTILENPVLFTDGKELKIFFTFCSKDNHEHIDALVSIANLIKESHFKEEIKNFKNEDDVANYIYSFVASSK